jgi:DNA-binding beta-propeller fold protein YncE
MLSKNLIAAAGNAGIPKEPWSLEGVTYKGAPINDFSVRTEELSPETLFFKPDGTKMYVAGIQGDDVIEYDLSTAWDISTASYLQNFFVWSQESSPQALFFKPDGTKMYVLGSSGDDVNEYDLSTAWDISTASYLQNFSVAAQDTSPTGLSFKPDGTKMYISGNAGDDVNEYDLSTAWDISTASYLQNFSVAAQETAPTGIFFKPDGTKMYVVGFITDAVNEYSLSTAWDVTTASYVQNFSVLTQESFVEGIFFKSDGTKFYIVGTTNDSVYQYDLSTAWDVSSASYSYPATRYFSVRTEDTSPSGLFFKPDGTKMYVLGDDVNEYDLSTGWDISTASYLQLFSVAAQDTEPTGIFFKPDGTKMYVVGTSGDAVNEYSLSAAWDISTASYVQNFSVAAQDSNPQALFFKPDGTKMYISGDAGEDIIEYDLSTAWDISTASYLQNFSIIAEDNNATGLFFKPDGTKMYIVGTQGDAAYEYDLSTAWDVTTASYVQNFSVALQEPGPQALFFKPDGTKMYIVGTVADAVFEYDVT